MTQQNMYILGGSSFYTLLLVESLQKFGLLKKLQTITLFGRNIQRLEIVAKTCSRLTKGEVQFNTSTDLRDVLAPKYTLIFNQIRFGGLKARQQDELLANKCGFAADETIGIVGVSNAIRAITAIKPMLEILQQKDTPYRLVNFTNPCSIVTQYMIEHFNIPAIGVCDYPAYMAKTIADKLSLDIDQIELDYFGLNHFGVVTKVAYQGRDIIDEVKRARLDFVSISDPYSPFLLNVSWRFVFEQDALLNEQSKKVNRATQLLDIDNELEQLCNDNIDDPEVYLSILNKRHCDWFNLAVSPLISNLINDGDYATYVNLPAEQPLLSTSPVCVMEGANNSAYSCIKNKGMDGLAETQEYLLIKQMKKAELQLLSAIVQGEPNGIIRSCLSNPMIRKITPVLRYFQQAGQLDETIFTIFKQRLGELK